MSDISKRIADLSPEKRALLTRKLRDQQKIKKDSENITRRPDRTAFPLSFSQQRMWFLTQWEPGSPFYNIFSAVRISGSLNNSILYQCIKDVITRHEVLRSKYLTKDGLPVQEIDPEALFGWEINDISEISADNRIQKLDEYIDHDMKTIFDLTEGMLVRARLITVDIDEYVFLLTMHHIVSDGWSIKIFIREVLSLYDAYSDGKTIEMEELDLQYADFAYWQRNRLQGQVLNSQLDYWKKQYKDKDLVLELPGDHPRPPVQTLNGNVFRFTFPFDLTQELRKFCKQNDTSLFMYLLAVFYILLYRYSSQNDIRVGIPMANRSREEIEKVIGLFVNTLVIEANFSEGITGRQFLDQVREKTLSAHQNQELPLEMLIEELDVKRDLRYTPLFQVMFTYQESLQKELNSHHLRLEILETDSTTSKFDLTLFIDDYDDGLKGIFEFNTDIFEPSTIERLADNFLVLSRSLVRNQDEKVDLLDLLTEEEKRKILVNWNDTFTNYPNDKTLSELFDQQVFIHSKEIAIRFPKEEGGEETLTYLELNEKVNQIARYLQKIGVRPDDLVGIFMERSLRMVVATLAVIKSGGAYLPLDVGYPGERINFMLSDCSVEIILTEKRYLVDLEAIESQSPPQGSTKENKRRHTIYLDDPNFLREIADESPLNPTNLATPDNLAYVMYTSGSTGIPKGVAIPHRAIVRLLFDTNYIDLTPSDRIAHASNPNFDAATLEIWGALLHGAQLVGVTKDVALSPIRYAGYLKSTGISVLFLTPALFNQIIKEEPNAFSTLKNLLVGGEQMDIHSAKVLLQNNPPEYFSNVYGPTESTTFTTSYQIKSIRENAQVVPIGKPISNTIVYIFDKFLKPVPIGVPGELYIGGDGLAREYFKRPELTSERFIKNPFHDLLLETKVPYFRDNRLYKTGDLVRHLPDGNIEFIGRLDFQVKIRGLRIELGEIEANIAQHGTISENVVVVLEDNRGEKRVVAYVVPEDRSTFNSKDLLAYLRGKLPEYMIPAIIILLDHLPLNENGKVDRRALPSPDFGELIEKDKYVHPESETELILVEIWEELLDVRPIGITDNFFALGGHSLLVTQLVSRIRHQFNIDVSVRTIFEKPVIRDLSVVIENQKAIHVESEKSVIPVLEDRSQMVLSFAQQRLWFLDKLQPGSPEYNVPFAILIKGELNRAYLQTSINRIIQRHEVLRTKVETINGRPFALILPVDSIVIKTQDFTEEPEKDYAINDFIGKEIQIPFDLEKDLLVRITLIQIGSNLSILFLVMHHIVSDGWSSTIFFNELSMNYASLIRNEAVVDLNPLPLQFYDYASWQRSRLQGDLLDQGIGFWKEYLNEIPPLLELPTDFPRPPMTSGKGDLAKFVFSVNLSDRLRILSRDYEVTNFMLFLSAFFLLLHRYSRSNDIVFGSPVSNRNHISLEQLIGFFVNTIAIRINSSEGMTFDSLLGEVKKSTLSALSNSEIPFEMVIQAIQPVRDLSYTPIFQVMFGFQEVKKLDAGFESSGLEMEPFDINAGTAKFDMTLTLSDEGENFVGALEYRTDLFSRKTAERMIKHYQSLLIEIGQYPEKPIDRIEFLGEDEKLRILKTWNNTEYPIPEFETVVSLFMAQASRTPDRDAVIFKSSQKQEKLSYAELDMRSSNLARWLKARGVQRGDLVCLFVERSVELMVGLLGILKSGGAYVPLDPIYPPERLRQIVNDVAEAIGKKPVMVTQSGLVDSIPEGIEEWLEVDYNWELNHQADIDMTGTEAHPEDLAYVLYTSGSTGKPKGVMIEHRNLVNLWVGMRRMVDYGCAKDGLRVSLNAPLLFDASVEQWLMLLSGETIVIVPQEIRMDGEKLLGWIKEMRIDILDCVPSQLKLLINAGLLRSDGGFRPKVIMPGGEAITNDVWKQLCETDHINFYNLYGPTECSVNSTICKISDYPQKPVIGKGMINSYLYVLDDLQQLAPDGVPGELYISGNPVGRGYLNKPELTATSFSEDPYNKGNRMYRTGDLVRWTDEGLLEYLGRLDNQVKLRGFRLELGDVESAISELPEVKEGVVVVREDQPGIKQLAGYIIFKEGAHLNINQIKTSLKVKLPDYMIPAFFVEVFEFPRTSSGKINRRALPKPEINKLEIGGEYVPPQTEEEQLLVAIWEDVLSINNIGINSNFFELGGDSILAIQVVAKANQSGLVITPRQIFEKQTIRELAEVSVKTDGSNKLKDEQGLIIGPTQLIPIQKWFFEQNFRDYWHWNQALLFNVLEPLDDTALQMTISALISQHDMLRSRFFTSHTGEWFCEIENETKNLPLEFVDLDDYHHSTSDTDDEKLIDNLANQHQSNLDITNGPVFKVINFKNGIHHKQWLLFIAHHLVIDGVSWRILIGDFLDFYSQIIRNQALVYPPKTTSFRTFADFLNDYAKTSYVLNQLDYWQKLGSYRVIGLPRDFPEGENIQDSVLAIKTSLSAIDTQLLTQKLPTSYGLRIEEALLTALTLSYQKWTGSLNLLLDLEGHGREEIHPDINTTRTVGWFTILYPVILRLRPNATLIDQLVFVKNQLDEAQSKGFTYGILRYLAKDEIQIPDIKSEISFNYLGNIIENEELDLLSIVKETPGNSLSPRSQRPYLIEIICSVLNGELQFEFRTSKNIYSDETVNRFTEIYMNYLNAIIEECSKPIEKQAGGSRLDERITGIGINQDEIDLILEEIGDITIFDDDDE